MLYAEIIQVLREDYDEPNKNLLNLVVCTPDIVYLFQYALYH